MEWMIRVIATTVVTYGLLKIFFTAQKAAEKNGKPKARWIQIAFWISWAAAFLIYISLIVLIVWVGVSMYLEHDIKGALTMLVTVLLVAPCTYFLFLSPLRKRRKMGRQ